MCSIDNIKFDDDLLLNYCGISVFKDLTKLPTIEKRINYCKRVIKSCEEDIINFNERKKISNYTTQCDIEIWIYEREDEIAVASHYLNNINANIIT